MLFNCEYMFDLLAADEDEARAAARLANAAEVVDDDGVFVELFELLLRPLAMLASLLIVSTVDLASLRGNSVVLFVGVAAGVVVVDELKLFAFESKSI
jgi:hypothetical protein